MQIIRDNILLAKALERKANPKYANEEEFRYKGITYNYETAIFPSARLQFQKYDRAYKNNKDFAEAFTRDLYRKNGELIVEINKGAKLEERIFYEETPPAAEQVAPGQAPPAGETPAAMTGGGLPPIPSGSFSAPQVIHTVPQTKLPARETAAPPKIAGLKNTAETGLDYEGKPYQMEATSPIKTAGKNLASQTQIGMEKGLTKVGGGFSGILGGVGRGAGSLLGGIGNGGVRLLSGAGGTLSSISTQMTRGRGIAIIPGRFLLIFSLAFLLIVALAAFAPAPDITPGSPPTAQVGIGDIASCQFTRSGASSSISSTKLLSLFQEVSAKSGVPAAALASLAMHETQDFTANAKDNHDAFTDPNPTSATGCKYFVSTKTDSSGNPIKIGSSATGALGVMQVQPPKSIHDAIAAQSGIPSFESVGAYSAEGVERGARMIGKTAASLTVQDFCDVRTSIYLGAGVLISKNGGKPPNTGDEVKQSVCGYYGVCQYGPYHYGEEAKKDFENCKSGGSIIPVGVGGARIASVADQISKALVHSTKPEDAEKRLDLADAGISCDPRGSYGPSYHCWIGMGNRPRQPYDQVGNADYLECTEFVWAVFDKAGYGAQIDYVRRGNAYEWPDRAREKTQQDKFIVFDNPQELQVGDIISEGTGENQGTAGHLAVVIARENNKIRVAQAATNLQQEDYFIQDGKLVINNVISSARCTPETVKGCRVEFIRLIAQ